MYVLICIIGNCYPAGFMWTLGINKMLAIKSCLDMATFVDNLYVQYS